MLRELYGPAAAKVHVEYKPWKITLPSGSTKEIEFATVSSAYHIEINPSDVGTNDRYVVQEIIKEMARSRPIGTSGEKTYKILILNEVDKLSKEAQAGLRRTMEKYANACRLVLCCNNVSKVIEPLRSRCLLVRVGAPQAAQCVDLLTRVAAQEGMGVPAGLIDNIVTTSRRNMRRALLSMEALAVRAGGEGLSENTPVVLPDWEMYIKEIAGDVMREQTAKNLFVVRGKLYELIVNCIPPEVILRTLVRELCRTLDDELKRQAVELAATYEWRLQQGQKAIFHLEAFIAKFMSVFKSYMVSLMG
jgi:replication factor C subunit 3/5